jgi:hypothetical protein
VKFFVLNTKPEFFENDIKNRPLCFVFFRLLSYHFYPKERKDQEHYKPDTLLKVLGDLNVVYNNSTKRRNPNELINFILSTLHHELNTLKDNNINNNKDSDIYNKKKVINYGINKFIKTNNSIISNAFNWFEIKELMCNQCSKLMYKFHTFNIFDLDILGCAKYKQNKNISIYDCLNYYVSIKKQNLVCSNCKNTQMSKQSKIFCSPKIFIFSLDRGNLDKELIDIKVSFKEDLDISSFVENKNSPYHYKLIGIVSIKKRTNPNGYDYCSFCKSSYDNQWYYYHDEEINSLNLQAIIKSHASIYTPCLLVYKSYKK